MQVIRWSTEGTLRCIKFASGQVNKFESAWDRERQGLVSDSLWIIKIANLTLWTYNFEKTNSKDLVYINFKQFFYLVAPSCPNGSRYWVQNLTKFGFILSGSCWIPQKNCCSSRWSLGCKTHKFSCSNK